MYLGCIPCPEGRMSDMRGCWCGNPNLLPFGPEYRECRVCGTLVSLTGLSDEQLVVHDDVIDFYGKQYWLKHQEQDLGFPDIYTRSRNDLNERNLHWLKTLMKYRLPPANVLEVGCAHGSFVALMRLTGYEASGVEMSPWVVDFGKKTFGVPIRIGPIETLSITKSSFSVIALMDVLEHLPDPIETLRYCLILLKPEGLLLVQTPQFIEGVSHETLVGSKSAFLDILRTKEHLYLFSERSVKEIFKRVGAEHIYFERAIFAQYDMFFAVSRMPLKTHSNGRFALALLDLRERELNLIRKHEECELDRAARAEQIATLTKMLRESELDRAARAEQIATLTKMLQESELDRAARAEQIATLTKMLQESEADRAALREWSETLMVDLRTLFSRPSFRWMGKFARWSELKKITDEFRKTNE
jgi:2-polyprenyl-3-methyl-5-hydroxy-6-metoxy-1,4-benzoquinol methylase